MSSGNRSVVHVSPHPDDEVIGAPATLMALRDDGWTVVNFACSLGRAKDSARRRRELTEACRRARFALVVPDQLPGVSIDDNPRRAQAELGELLAGLLVSRHPQLVVSPSPHDAHHGHEVVARALRDAVERVGKPIHWAMWGLWSDLALPNLLTPFDAERLREINDALQAHVGEVQRNNYPALIESRAAMNAVLGIERVFGFGARRSPHRYAEILMHAVYNPDGWSVVAPSLLDTRALLSRTGIAPIGWWLSRESDRARLRHEIAVRGATPRAQ